MKLNDAIYILHAFQKKSKKGISTPRQEINLIKKRLFFAREDAKNKMISVRKTPGVVYG